MKVGGLRGAKMEGLEAKGRGEEKLSREAVVRWIGKKEAWNPCIPMWWYDPSIHVDVLHRMSMILPLAIIFSSHSLVYNISLTNTR